MAIYNELRKENVPPKTLTRRSPAGKRGQGAHSFINKGRVISKYKITSEGRLINIKKEISNRNFVEAYGVKGYLEYVDD